MADQILTPTHPHCQPILDRITALTEATRLLSCLAETDDPQDAHRAARYLETAVIMAAEDIQAMTSQEVVNV